MREGAPGSGISEDLTPLATVRAEPRANRSAAASRHVVAVLAVQEAMGADAVPMMADDQPRLNRHRLGTKISAQLLLLAARLASTASATFARMGLGSVEAKVLFCLGDGPQTASRVGKMVGVDRAAICRAAQTLAGRELVVKTEGPIKDLNLTPLGHAVMHQVKILVCEREERILSGFSHDDRLVLAGLLGRLMINIPDLDTLAESKVFAAGNDQ